MPTNDNWPFGLQPLVTRSGGTPFTNRFPLNTNYATAIYKGQILIQSTTGYVRVATSTEITAGWVPGKVAGVAAEHYGGATDYAKGQTDIALWDAGEHIFVIQSDGATTTAAASDFIGNMFIPTGSYVNTGDSTTGLSTCRLDYSSKHATTAHLLKCMGQHKPAGDKAWGAYCKVKVVFTNQFNYGQETSTTAV